MYTYIDVYNYKIISWILFYCSCSVTKSCLTLCDPMDCSTPGFSGLSPWVCSNSCPLSQWCHPTISFSIAPFPSCPQSFPASPQVTKQVFWLPRALVKFSLEPIRVWSLGKPVEPRCLKLVWFFLSHKSKRALSRNVLTCQRIEFGCLPLPRIPRSHLGPLQMWRSVCVCVSVCEYKCVWGCMWQCVNMFEGICEVCVSACE